MFRSVSILIPTLNAAKVLKPCLEAIAAQDYPKELIEIVIADGGSADDTLAIAREHTDKIFPNPLKTGEAGKAVALRNASGEIVAFVDSDNILPTPDWLRRMMEPFDDSEIVASEPLQYTYRAQDGMITRYCALIGMNDPLCLFLGNYDRYCQLTGKWTELPVEVEERADYLKVGFPGGRLPTIGANGFLMRRSELAGQLASDYLFDIDVLYEIAATRALRIAKVKTGIIHLFCGEVSDFSRKQKRRVRDYLYYQSLSVRKYPWGASSRAGLIKFVLATVTVLPLLWQSLRGYLRQPDVAWFFHPVACWITLWQYGWGRIGALFIKRGELSRADWRQ
ncbi:MAG: glycosyltransferase [Verrucomicrobiia bacterium]|jgi:glycosyltransferase involved in cell wall biosynthesis